MTSGATRHGNQQQGKSEGEEWVSWPSVLVCRERIFLHFISVNVSVMNLGSFGGKSVRIFPSLLFYDFCLLIRFNTRRACETNRDCCLYTFPGETVRGCWTIASKDKRQKELLVGKGQLVA